jgi:hypothetical protein
MILWPADERRTGTSAWWETYDESRIAKAAHSTLAGASQDSRLDHFLLVFSFGQRFAKVDAT